MFKFNLIHQSIGMILLGSLSFSSSVTGQTDSKAEATEQRIVVTGSKLKRLGAIAPNPMTVITGSDIQNAGITNVGELLNKLPSSNVGISPETSNNTIFANGLNKTSLRGLGSSRTLVLVNGRRFVGGSAGSSAVDLNSIPTATIDRIEVVTGGASAVYGSDAIAGVVNIITRKLTDGVELDASYTKPSQNGGEKAQLSFTYGTAFAEDKGTMIFNVTANDAKQIRDSDRDFTALPMYGVYNADDTGDSDGIPQRLAWEGVRRLNWLNYPGVFFGGAAGKYTFDDSGNLKVFDEGSGPVTTHSREGNYCTGSCDGWNPVDTSIIATPVERKVFSFSSNYNISDDINLIAELTYANTEANGESTPVFHRNVPILSGNPFIKDDLRTVMTDAGMSQIGLYRMTSEFGNRKYNQDRTTKRYVFGVEGALSYDWNFSAYYQKGELKDETLWTGQTITARWEQALDAVLDNGNIVCRDQSNGCVPLNILGRNQASQAALDWVSTAAGRTSKTTQEVLSVVVDGDLFTMPAGVMSVAFGAEYREETSSTDPDQALIDGSIFGNESLPMKGEFDVTEFSFETSIPLVSDTFLVNSLSLELAYRYMDYSSAGSHDAWKAGINWDVNEDFKFRATSSRSVRAPNVGELFAPQGQTYESFSDVCRASDIDQGNSPANRQANCRTANIPVGWSPSADWDKGNHPGYNQGNINLKPEQSDDYTVGFVYTPSYVEDLTITVDYWGFEIEDAINSLDIDTSVRYCYDSENLNNLFCEQFRRSANFDIDWFVQQSLNLASYETSGTDFEANYIIDMMDAGALRLNFITTYLQEFEYNPTGFEEDIDVDVGEYTNPRWKARATFGWSYDELYVQMLGRYHHSSVTANHRTAEDYDYVDISSNTVWDLSGSYNITEDFQVRLGVLNIFDKAPPRNPVVYDGAGYYDTVGRAPFIGVNYKFN